MKLFFGIFTLIIITIEAQDDDQIQIFEIHESDTGGVQIDSVNSKEQGDDLLLKLFGDPKPKKETLRLATELVNKLKLLRNERKTNRHHDNARIYILNSEDFDESTDEDTAFVDETRNDHSTDNIEKKEIRDLLLQLLRPERKKPLQKKRMLALKSARRMTKPVLTTDDDDGSTS